MNRTVLTWIFLIVAGGLVAVGLRYTSWVHYSSGTQAYFLEVEEVRGLNEGTEVFLAGFQVGKVEQIRLIPEPSIRFDLELRIRRDISVPEGTEAVVLSRGFGGIRVIELELPKGIHETFLSDGDRLVARSEADLGDVILRADQAFRQLGDVAADLKDFTSAEVDEPGLLQTVARFESTLSSFETTLESAQAVLDRLDRTALSVDVSFTRGIEDFSKTMATVDQVAKQLDSVVSEEKQALDSVLREANTSLIRLQSVLEGLDEESLANLYSSLEQLDAASRDMAILMKAMKARPLHTLRKGVPGEEAEGQGQDEEIDSPGPSG